MGTTADSILFTANASNIDSAYWDGISPSTNDTFILDHVIIENASFGIRNILCPSLHKNQSISSTTFRENHTGIFLIQGFDLDSCHFIDNDFGIEQFNLCRATNCTFVGNSEFALKSEGLPGSIF